MNSALDRIKEVLKENEFTGSKDYFTLENDGDSAIVVFLHGDDKEKPLNLDFAAVYPVTLPIRGDTRTIRKYVLVKDRQTDPLAKHGYRPVVRALFQLVEVEEKNGEITYSDIKIWDRGQQHIREITSIIEELGPLCNIPIKIRRDGKKGDRNTKYHILALQNKVSQYIIPDLLPETEDINEEGKYFMDLTQEEMQKIVDGDYYLEPYKKGDDDNTEKLTDKVKSAYEQQKQQPVQSGTTPPPPILDPETNQWITPVFDKATNQWTYPKKENKGDIF